MTRSKGRSGRPWVRLAHRVLRENPVCWLCGHDIDLTLPPTDRMSGTADHVIPLDAGGPPRDPDNVKPAHRSCNSRKGNRTTTPAAPTSRAW